MKKPHVAYSFKCNFSVRISQITVDQRYHEELIIRVTLTHIINSHANVDLICEICAALYLVFEHKAFEYAEARSQSEIV